MILTGSIRIRRCGWIIMALLLRPAMAQVIDSFADGDFTQNPTWMGDEAAFVVRQQRLELQASPQTDKAYLATYSQALDAAEWSFVAGIGVNPSSSNYIRVYLAANRPQLTEELQGYFVLIGGANDEISLYAQDGSRISKTIDGRDNALNLSPFTVAVRVTRSKAGAWQLFSDVGLTGQWTLEGEAADNGGGVPSRYFGVACYYTPTRVDKFWFDDFRVDGVPYQDRTPLSALSIRSISDTAVTLLFNKAPHSAQAADPARYTIEPGASQPVSATVDATGREVTLTFAQPLINGQRYTLLFYATDEAQRASAPSTAISWHQGAAAEAVFKDIIINEIMANPSPPVGLPEVEFVELYNRSNRPIDMSGWLLGDTRSSVALPPAATLPPHAYGVIAPVNAALGSIGENMWQVAGFPTLNNDDETLTLKSSAGLVIDSLHYTQAWYRSNVKQVGGWSLELIDTDRHCSDQENWSSSEDIRGGTPGKVNSIRASRPDLAGPRLLYATALTAEEVTLIFNERMENPPQDGASFVATPSLTVKSYALLLPEAQAVRLKLERPLQAKQPYTMEVSGLADCSGNAVAADANRVDFGLVQQPTPGEALIGEVLFNPRVGGVDFVEIYNPTEAYLNLKNGYLISYDAASTADVTRLTEEPSVLAPHAYRVFTPDPTLLADQYPHGDATTFQRQELPLLPDAEGTLVLARSDNVSLDSVRYEAHFHSPFLRSVEGVSLERIAVGKPATSASNWQSASSVVGFASPGRVNSNARNEASATPGSVRVDPPIFAPQSASNNFTIISFHFDKAGWVGTVSILDHQGRVIRTLANNATLGLEGSFRWDGERDGQNQQRTGYYYVLFDLFDAQGEKKMIRERIVVTAP